MLGVLLCTIRCKCLNPCDPPKTLLNAGCTLNACPRVGCRAAMLCGAKVAPLVSYMPAGLLAAGRL